MTPETSFRTLNGPLLALIPERARLVDPRRAAELDFAAFRRRIAERAEALAEAGLGPGGRAVVARERPLDYLADLFALWSLGASAVGVNPGVTAEERGHILRASGAAAFLDESPLEAAGPPARPAPLGLDAPALILMTSGTTGRPKGIVHTQRSLAARMALNLAAIGREDLADSLCVLPLHFGHGLIGNVLTPLAAGARLHLLPKPDLGEIRDLGARLDREGIGFLSSAPAFWTLATKLSPRPQRPLKRVHVGSAPLSAEAWRAVADWTGTRRVFNLYGMTETANWIAGAGLDEDGADGFVGRAWGGALAVLTAEGEIREEGSGEVLVASPSVMTEYLGLPEETARAFLGPWLRTGDTGRLDASGALTLIGRIKHEINRGGVKIPAEEIDLLLERHPLVEEACAFPLPDPAAGEMVAAAVVLREGGDLRAIRLWCRERCRAEAVPERLFALKAIPRNERGKVSREAVKAAALASAAAPL